MDKRIPAMLREHADPPGEMIEDAVSGAVREILYSYDELPGDLSIKGLPGELRQVARRLNELANQVEKEV